MAVIPLAPHTGLLPDSTLPGGSRFEVERTLSAGGFGIAYLCRDRQFDDVCVVKELALTDIVARDTTAGSLVPLPGRAADVAYWVEKVVREARLLNRIRNEAVVTVRSVWQERGTAFYAMDFVDGVEFPARPSAGWDWQTCEPVFRRMLEGLDAIHSAGLIHSDVKPSNILVNRSGQPVFIDFGTARTGEEIGKTQLTTVAFTPGYAPPELESRDRGKEVGPWSDLYSLAMVFIGLFAQHPGLEGNPLESRMRETLSRHALGADPYNDEFKGQLALAGMPQPWVALVTDCVALDPSRRPRSVAACMERIWSSLDTGGADGSLRAHPFSKAGNSVSGAVNSSHAAPRPLSRDGAASLHAASMSTLSTRSARAPQAERAALEVMSAEQRRDAVAQSPHERLMAYYAKARLNGEWFGSHFGLLEAPRKGVADPWASTRSATSFVAKGFFHRRWICWLLERFSMLVTCGLLSLTMTFIGIEAGVAVVLAWCIASTLRLLIDGMFEAPGQPLRLRRCGLEIRRVVRDLPNPRSPLRSVGDLIVFLTKTTFGSEEWKWRTAPLTEFLGAQPRYIVGSLINTRDRRRRTFWTGVPLLVQAMVVLLMIERSERLALGILVGLGLWTAIDLWTRIRHQGRGLIDVRLGWAVVRHEWPDASSLAVVGAKRKQAE